MEGKESEEDIWHLVTFPWLLTDLSVSFGRSSRRQFPTRLSGLWYALGLHDSSGHFFLLSERKWVGDLPWEGLSFLRRRGPFRVCLCAMHLWHSKKEVGFLLGHWWMVVSLLWLMSFALLFFSPSQTVKLGYFHTAHSPTHTLLQSHLREPTGLPPLLQHV